MIDLHCHFLPNIDDGPSNIGDSLKLARMACAYGIQKSIVTPHICPGCYENNIMTIQPAFTVFKHALQQNHIPLQVGMAAEVRIGFEIIEMIEKNLIPFLGRLEGYHILLLEMPYSHIPPGSDKMVNWLLEKKIRPMIAHPEKNGDVLRNLEKIYPFIEQGCLLQITASSITGRLGSQLQQRAQQMLEKGWVNVIASDAHNIKYRPPDLESGYLAAAKIIGESAAYRLVHETPEQITLEKFIDIQKTKQPPTKDGWVREFGGLKSLIPA
ncbi:CpsB/CapC family capsule biosynthesis tyrosine phosphatase [Candidatus Parabeggiatoa sp. HSG14]|uniref:tyrosine-protein phosphatase n=1 Tax=Candidatus Parabeggiatoa sp. HSG14 TaxID=3055593 RepID=UPI0025A72B55|nr:hypothetical protein [Thiotrichales bacterium HSG14]